MPNNLSCKNTLPAQTLLLFYEKHQIYSFPRFGSFRRTLLYPPSLNLCFPQGVRYAIGVGSRKCSKAEVILREGTGKIVINGNLDGVDFFDSFLERAQLLTPLAFLGRIEDFDIEAEVQGDDSRLDAHCKLLR